MEIGTWAVSPPFTKTSFGTLIWTSQGTVKVTFVMSNSGTGISYPGGFL